MIPGLDARGPWDLESADEQGDAARGGSHVIAGGLVFVGADGVEMHTQRGGTCDRCGQAIMYVCRLRNAAGEVARVGQDCALTMCAPRDRERVTRAMSAREKAHRAARRERRAALSRERYAPVAVRCATLRDASAEGSFAAQFARSLACQIDSGSVPSDRQLALLARLESEAT